MNRFFWISLLPLVLTVTAEIGIPITNDKDTLRVNKSGVNNQIKINTLCHDGGNDSLVYGIQGEIIQTGENNRVEISSGREASNSKNQSTNNNQQIPDSRKNHITIKQAGKNNSAIIHTP